MTWIASRSSQRVVGIYFLSGCNFILQFYDVEDFTVCGCIKFIWLVTVINSISTGCDDTRVRLIDLLLLSQRLHSSHLFYLHFKARSSIAGFVIDTIMKCPNKVENTIHWIIAVVIGNLITFKKLRLDKEKFTKRVYELPEAGKAALKSTVGMNSNDFYLQIMPNW